MISLKAQYALVNLRVRRHNGPPRVQPGVIGPLPSAELDQAARRFKTVVKLDPTHSGEFYLPPPARRSRSRSHGGPTAPVGNRSRTSSLWKGRRSSITIQRRQETRIQSAHLRTRVAGETVFLQHGTNARLENSPLSLAGLPSKRAPNPQIPGPMRVSRSWQLITNDDLAFGRKC
jgi:hypothetical protein